MTTKKGEETKHVIVYHVVDPARGSMCADPGTTRLLGVESLAALNRDQHARMWTVEQDALETLRYLLHLTPQRVGITTLLKERPGPGCSRHVPLTEEELKSFTMAYEGLERLRRAAPPTEEGGA